MSRHINPHARVSIYQIEGPLDPEKVLRASYLDRDDFSVLEVNISGRLGLFVRGVVSNDAPSWGKLVEGWTHEPELIVGLGNTTSAAVLLLPTRDATSGLVWAISFGMGYHLIDSTKMVPGVGRRLAVRCAKPESLRSITHSRLDSRAYVARTSIPGGDDLSGFGASELGDLVSRVVGPANLDGLLVGSEETFAELRGADAISLPVARDGALLLRDLDAIEDLLDRRPAPELEMIEQLRSLKSTDEEVPHLENLLDRALHQPEDEKLGLAWPTELADEASPLDFIIVSGKPGRRTNDDVRENLSLDSILSPLRNLPNGQRVRRLNLMRVQAFSGDDEPSSSQLRARQWLVFETLLGGHRYCMHEGRWYMVDDGIDRRLSDRLSGVFDADPAINGVPEWPAWMGELEYNKLLAESLGGVCLDRVMVRCDSNPRGFESCDVLSPAGVFVHVKKVGRSTGASHLFAQAGVSAQTLLDDASARSALVELVKAAGGDESWVPERPSQAVLVMANRRVLGAESLFSFSRMRLLRLYDECRRQGVELTIMPLAFGD